MVQMMKQEQLLKLHSLSNNLDRNLHTKKDLLNSRSFFVKIFKFDDFWVQDYIIPLGTEKAGDKITTAIDGYYRDDCDKKNKLVFHGQIKDLNLPGFSWVEDGKLLFKGVKLTKPDDEKKDN